MPIYEYLCPACGKSFDAMQKFSDAPLTECRLCHATGIKKALTAPGFALKGSGWYATDFKGGSSAKPSSDEASKPSADAGKTPATESASTSASADAAPACGAGACAACAPTN